MFLNNGIVKNMIFFIKIVIIGKIYRKIFVNCGFLLYVIKFVLINVKGVLIIKCKNICIIIWIWLILLVVCVISEVVLNLLNLLLEKFLIFW